MHRRCATSGYRAEGVKWGPSISGSYTAALGNVSLVGLTVFVVLNFFVGLGLDHLFEHQTEPGKGIELILVGKLRVFQQFLFESRIPLRVLVEAHLSGSHAGPDGLPALVLVLGRRPVINIDDRAPTKDKDKRGQSIRARMRAGKVRFDKNSEWYPAL